MKLIVDGRTVDIHKPRFEVYSPYMTVQLPPDNDFGVPAQASKITAFGWDVLVRNLRVGKHLITTVVTYHDGVTAPFHHYINIVPRGHSGDGD